jgi:hypothetical protein
MAIFQPITSTINPIDPIIPQGQGEAPVAAGLASLSKLFMSAGEAPTRALTQDEVLGQRWDEYRQVSGNPDLTPGNASFADLRNFGKMFPELESKVFEAAKTGRNPDVQAYDAQTAVQIEIDKAWQTSSEGIYASAASQSFATAEEQATYLAQSKAEWLTTSAENDKLKREVGTIQNYTVLSDKAWNNNLSYAQTEANIFSRGLVQLSEAISKDPTASLNLDEMGVSALIPELRGTVVTQSNFEEVAAITRGALATKYRKDISMRTGIPENELGQSPEGWDKGVFNQFDATLNLSAKNVDPIEIQKRLNSQAYQDMAAAGVPVQYLTTIATLSAADPALSAQLMAGLSGSAGKFTEELLAGRLEEANKALKESSKKDLIDARYAFTELVATMSGQSTVARSYEEVTQDQKDTDIKTAILGAITSHEEIQSIDGPVRWNAQAWKQTFEVPSASIVKAAQADPEFASKTSQFLSTDVMLDLGNLRDAAVGDLENFNFTVGKNGQLSITTKSAETKFVPGARAIGLAQTKEAQDAMATDRLNKFITANKAKIDDLNYKLQVLNGLGVVGETSKKIIYAELGITDGTTTAATSSGNGYKAPDAVLQDINFMGKVKSVSADIGINPNDLLRVIEFETGKSFSPSVRPYAKDGKRISSAVGLIQFLESTAKGLGTTTEALAGMTATEQMEYVGKYLAPNKGKLKNFGDVYMAVHWPAAVGKDEAYVMYEKGSQAYEGNKNLDTNGDGTVTRGESIASVLSRTGGGVMTTPYTAEAEKMIQPEAQLLPPELTGGVTAPSPDMATTPQPVPVEALPATTPALSAQEQAIRQEAEGKTAANTPIDQKVMDTIKMLAANPNDVRVFATQDELIQAYNNQELRLGSLVVINGEVKAVTQDMVGAK